MSVKEYYPVSRPSLNLDFANSKTVDPRITFTRASSATYFDEKGVMRTAPAGVPRIDHDPVTGECKGLLIEEQRTNLLTYSEDFSNAAWRKTRSSITANATTAPDGSLTADKLVEDTTANLGHITYPPPVSITVGQVYSISVYAKAGERSVLQVVPDGGIFPTTHANFDLITGMVSAIGTSGTASIVPIGNGWYRCSLVATATANAANNPCYFYLSNSPTTPRGAAYTGDGTSGLYIWGAQLEAGAFPTAYIKTEASEVTRAADSASMLGENFSSWYRQDEGTVVGEFDIRQTQSNNQFGFSINYTQDSSGNRWSMNFEPNSSLRMGSLRNTNSAGLNFLRTTNTYTIGNNKAALAISNGASLVLNGGAVSTTAVYGPPIVDRLQIGNQIMVGFLNGHIRKLAYYPERLSNDNLIALTN